MTRTGPWARREPVAAIVLVSAAACPRRGGTIRTTAALGSATMSLSSSAAVVGATVRFGRRAPRSGVAMFTARAPVLPSWCSEGGPPPCGSRVFRRIPQPSVGEPLHHDVGVGATQLVERRQQVVGLRGAKRRRAVVDEEGPVRKARRHVRSAQSLSHRSRAHGWRSRRLSFSTSVVRLSRRRRAAWPLLPPVRSSDR